MFLSSSRGFTELDQQMSRQCRPSGKGGGKNAPIPLLIECPNNLLAVVFVYELSVLLLANLAAVLEHLALLALLQLHAHARLGPVEQEAIGTLAQLLRGQRCSGHYYGGAIAGTAADFLFLFS